MLLECNKCGQIQAQVLPLECMGGTHAHNKRHLVIIQDYFFRTCTKNNGPPLTTGPPFMKCSCSSPLWRRVFVLQSPAYTVNLESRLSFPVLLKLVWQKDLHLCCCLAVLIDEGLALVEPHTCDIKPAFSLKSACAYSRLCLDL